MWFLDKSALKSLFDFNKSQKKKSAFTLMHFPVLALLGVKKWFREQIYLKIIPNYNHNFFSLDHFNWNQKIEKFHFHIEINPHIGDTQSLDQCGEKQQTNFVEKKRDKKIQSGKTPRF